jgi:hypothetical protein
VIAFFLSRFYESWFWDFGAGSEFFLANPRNSIKLHQMSRLPASSRTSACLTTGAFFAAAVVVSLGAASSAQAAWGVLCPTPQARSAPPDQSWMKDVPEKPATKSRGKVAVFVFKGDDVFEQSRGAVVRALRKQGVTVFASLRPSDTPSQYRQVSYSSGIALFIDGEVTGTGSERVVQLRLRSGVTGQYVGGTRFTSAAATLVATIERSLWTKVGPATVRACASAAKPRKRGFTPMYIEAGSPLDRPLGS